MRKFMLMIIVTLIIACQPVSSSTDIPATPQLDTTSLPISTPTIINNKNCVTPEFAMADLNYSAILMDDMRNISIYNSTSGELTDVRIPKETQVIVSPNFLNIIYTRYLENQETELILMDSSGKSIQYLILEGWLGIVGWVDGTKLILTESEKDLMQNVVLLDTENFTLTKISLNYQSLPDFDNVNNLMNWYPLKISPNADFSYFIYPSTMNGGNIVLWNYKNNSKIIEFPAPNAFTHQPKWLISSEKFLFVGQKEPPPFITGMEKMDFYTVKTSGEISQVSDMAKNYERLRISSFEVSPNEKQIAFWAIFNEGLPKLTLLNIDTNQFTIFCVENISASLEGIFWSPDSQYILLTSKDNLKNASILVLDSKKNKLYKVVEDYAPLGWIINP